MIYFVRECGTNCFAGDQFFHRSCGGVFMLFYILCFSQVMCGWMDGWMVISPAEFFHLCGWMTMLVC